MTQPQGRDVQQPDTWSHACYRGNHQACSGYDDDSAGLCECAHHDHDAAGAT